MAVGHLTSQVFMRKVSRLSPPSTVTQWATLLAWSKEAEGCFWGPLVTTPISVQCHSCKQSHGSVLAALTTSALPERKKEKSEIISWPVSRPHLARLLYSNRPGDDTPHTARNLFCYYRAPPASVFNSGAFITALRSCSFCQLFCLCPRTLRDFRSLKGSWFSPPPTAHCMTFGLNLEFIV